jgi:HPt (histidine-containing phosphotransfer) domain-containing protein
MDDFVTKPVVPGRFYATMVKWMQRPADVETQTDASDGTSTQPGALPAMENVQSPALAPQPAVPRPPETVGGRTAVQAPEAAGATAPELLDLSVLTQLTRRNPKMMREIATVFLAFMERTMNELDAALLAGDRAKLSALGHKAKSSAAAVGAMSLSGLCHRLESSMKDPTAGLDQAHHLVTEIRAQMGPIADKFARALA